jgi:hypothetical protein
MIGKLLIWLGQLLSGSAKKQNARIREVMDASTKRRR